MKEMIYSAEPKREILDTGFCLGFLYYIMNLGTHPTAYIKIPSDNDYYKKSKCEMELDVHGGITYADEYLHIGDNEIIDGWFIGWDYAHYMDYCGYEELLEIRKIFDRKEFSNLRTPKKKWTTQEIFEEVKETCFQLSQVKKVERC